MVIRQERLYGISSISDNIGEAFYAATSPTYKQWTPAVRRDADNDGIPNTIGDRYRYFMHRAGENVIRNPGFYFRNISVLFGIRKYLRFSQSGIEQIFGAYLGSQKEPTPSLRLLAEFDHFHMGAANGEAVCSIKLAVSVRFPWTVSLFPNSPGLAGVCSDSGGSDLVMAGWASSACGDPIRELGDVSTR